MLIKFFKHGQGAGEPPVNYLVAKEVLAYDENRDLIRDECGLPTFKTRDPLPEVLKGNTELTIELINGCPHKWSYRAGVIAFADGDNPSEAQQREVMDAFERLAFAGLEGNQYDILWVRHEHEGNVELHFCTPRLELTTGKSLNIAPPGYQQTYDTLRDYLNKTHGWADPMDVSRRLEAKRTIEAPDRAESREALHEWVGAQIVAGHITNRPTMIQAFEEIGFTINRQGKDYLSVNDPETDQKFRLKGEIYHEHWNAAEYQNEYAQRTLAGENAGADQGHRRLDRRDLGELRDGVRALTLERATYNGERYSRSYDANSRDVSETEIRRDEVEPAALAHHLPDVGHDELERVGDRGDQQTNHDEPLRTDGGLLEQHGARADDHHRADQAQHNQMHALWARLLLPETEGGMNVTHAFGEGVTRICEGAERSLRAVREYVGRANPVLERITRIASKLADGVVGGLRRIHQRTNELREANDELIERWTETDYRREQAEKAVGKLESKLERKARNRLGLDLEL